MKTIILSIVLTKLKNEVHVQFHELVYLLLLKLSELFSPLKVLCEQYKIMLDNEKTALDYLKESELTAQIVEKDRLRDMIYRGFSAAVKGFRNHFNPEVREAANTLWSIFVAYGNVTQRSFDAETTAINDFLEELKAPKAAEALKKLNVEDWAAELGVENARFQELMVERYSEAAQRNAHRMKVARAETDRYYKAIIGVLEGQAVAGSPGEDFDSLITEVNAVIARFKNILAQEYGRRNAVRGQAKGPEAGAEGSGENPVQETPEV